MWIMLTKKLPVRPSPPKLSIFYANPWTDKGHANHQEEKLKAGWLDELSDGSLSDGLGFGYEHDYRGAMAINFKGHTLRVFPDEFSVLTPERMRDYVFGMEGEGIPTHVLVENNEASGFLLRNALETDLRNLYDAALIDGCNPQMAHMVAMGIPVDDVLIEFPDIGWYRCLPEFALIYCDEWEITEDEPLEKALNG